MQSSHQPGQPELLDERQHVDVGQTHWILCYLRHRKVEFLPRLVFAQSLVLVSLIRFINMAEVR